MMFKSTLFVTLAASIASMVNAASLSGADTITPQDYYGLPASALANNPPACGMPYNELNLARITAVAAMKTDSTCGLCLKVVNSADTSKFIYVLAVDLGGRGLDLSIPSFEYLFGQRYDASPASWTTVASSYCAGIYTPGKINTNQGVGAGSSSPNTTTKKTTTTTTKAATKTTTKATTKTTTKAATKTTTKASTKTTTKAVTKTTTKATTKTTTKTTTTKKPKATTTKKTKTTTTKKTKTSTKKTKNTTRKSKTNNGKKPSTTKSRSAWWRTARSHRVHGDQKRRQH